MYIYIYIFLGVYYGMVILQLPIGVTCPGAGLEGLTRGARTAP